MVGAVKLVGVFNGNYIANILYHAYNGLVSAFVAANGAQLGIGYVVALAAIAYLVAHAHHCTTKVLHLLGGLF
jgi:hypothetical protein